ncbi:RNA-binding protein [Actinidia chinensis var. chinensis]|uniref:RNA-binding protein n=1 Tax=Actinidia chinensis var. chinensis TaxID=1590841 RepID=A0A2R6QP00_ACTCC|nr:RNA-binding protein [Actinidia chinensis var. chinensis]
MAAMEAACSLFSSCLPSSPSLRLHISTSNLALSVKSPPYPFPRLCVNATRKLGSFKVFSVVEEIAVEDKPDEKTQLTNPMRKLCVQNLPWSFTVDDMKTVFGECGTVADIEIIKQKDGKSRGFAFVTMDYGEEAQAVIDKFNSQNCWVGLSGLSLQRGSRDHHVLPPQVPQLERHAISCTFPILHGK